MDTPADLRYTDEHAWIRSEADGILRIGITDYAQDALGEIVYVDLPDVGSRFGAGDSFGELESAKSVSDVYSPVDAVVTETNEALTDDPTLVNSAPYTDGWLILLKPDSSNAADISMDADAYALLTKE